MFSLLFSLIKYLRLKFKYPNNEIGVGSSISSSSLGRSVKLFKDVTVIDSRIGDFTYVQSGAVINNAVVGRYCSIAAGVTIGGGEHPLYFLGTSPVFFDSTCPLPDSFVDKNNYGKAYVSQTVIQADVWIGQNAIIRSGVVIGVGSVIGAGAVVVKDVEPYSVVGGVPAKHIKFRFPLEVRSRLCGSQWWEVSPDLIRECNDCFSNPAQFLDKLQKKLHESN